MCIERFCTNYRICLDEIGLSKQQNTTVMIIKENHDVDQFIDDVTKIFHSMANK